jgi:hypothetical protein
MTELISFLCLCFGQGGETRWQGFLILVLKNMKEKQFEPAKNNDSAPEKGIAAVNTHNPGEEPVEDQMNNENAQPLDEKKGRKKSLH